MCMNLSDLWDLCPLSTRLSYDPPTPFATLARPTCLHSWTFGGGFELSSACPPPRTVQIIQSGFHRGLEASVGVGRGVWELRLSEFRPACAGPARKTRLPCFI